jgi:uncharacterized protein with NRDE domain
VCLILVAFRVNPDIPLVVAANRDEYYARPSEPPSRVPSSHPAIVAGRDAERGGTWMGFTAAGFFAGLTNQRTVGPPEPARRSRGEVVMRALRAGSVEGVERFLAETDAREYNPFHLVFGDAAGVRVASTRPDEARIAVQALSPGVHMLANGPLDARTPKTARAEVLVRPWIEKPWAELRPALQRLLADHEKPRMDDVPPSPSWMPRSVAQELQAICVHTEPYGTRSATVAALRPGHTDDYWFAPGAPCKAAYEDITPLLAGG